MRRGRWRPGRQTPKVVDGRVQRKNRWDHYAKTYPIREGSDPIPIVREPAVRRARHLVSEHELRTFIRLVPDWPSYSDGIRCLVLGDGDDDSYGWHNVGVICINAWYGELETLWSNEFFQEHAVVLDRLLVPCEPGQPDDEVLVKFTRKTAAAFLLMHVLLHEVGHHYDRMRTKKQTHAPGGENFAENFGNELADRMWPAFFRAFGF